MLDNNSTVYVVEDDDDMRLSMIRMITSCGVSVEAFHSPRDFLDSFSPEHHGCLILDLRLPVMSGMQLFEKLRSDEYHIPVIFVTAHAEVEVSVEAMRRGAWDFMEKPFSRNRLVDRINEAIQFDADQRTKLAERRAVMSRIDSLTDRESDILRHIMAGNSTKETAKELKVSPKTVEGHRGRLYRKLGVSSLPQLSLLMAKFYFMRDSSHGDHHC